MMILKLTMYELFSFHESILTLSKARIRSLFKDILGISQDEDFINHSEAGIELIAQFEEHGEPAPNLADLHFDLYGDTRSIWNTTVFDMLRKEFLRREDNVQYYKLPTMSDDFLETLIVDRFTRLKQTWTKGERQFHPDGTTETDGEVQARLIASREVKLKAIRHRERRSTVRNFQL